MPTPTYIPMATVTLGASASAVTFSSIPATYRDLVLIIDALAATGDSNVRIAFNGDTTDNNYVGQHMSGPGTFIDAGALVGSQRRYLTFYGYMETTSRVGIITHVQDANATDKHKTYLTKADNASTGTTTMVARYLNAGAITSITLGGEASNFAAASTFSLYGIES